MKPPVWPFAIFFLVLAATAYSAAPAKSPDEVTLTGTVIDNACAGQHQRDLSQFIKTHTKECALMPNCVKSGYSLYTADGRVTAFAVSSNPMVAEFLKKKDSRLTVQVTGKRFGKLLILHSIKNI